MSELSMALIPRPLPLAGPGERPEDGVESNQRLPFRDKRVCVAQIWLYSCEPPTSFLEFADLMTGMRAETRLQRISKITMVTHPPRCSRFSIQCKTWVFKYVSSTPRLKSFFSDTQMASRTTTSTSRHHTCTR